MHRSSLTRSHSAKRIRFRHHWYTTWFFFCIKTHLYCDPGSLVVKNFQAIRVIVWFKVGSKPTWQYSDAMWHHKAPLSTLKAISPNCKKRSYEAFCKILDRMVINAYYNSIYFYIPRTTKLLGGYIGFAPSARLSVTYAMHALWRIAYLMDFIHKHNPWEDNVSRTISRLLGQTSRSHGSFEFVRSEWGVSK